MIWVYGDSIIDCWRLLLSPLVVPSGELEFGFSRIAGLTFAPFLFEPGCSGFLPCLDQVAQLPYLLASSLSLLRPLLSQPRPILPSLLAIRQYSI